MARVVVPSGMGWTGAHRRAQKGLPIKWHGRLRKQKGGGEKRCKNPKVRKNVEKRYYYPNR